MQDLIQTINELPATALIPLGVLLAAGLVLWASGRRVLRGAVAVIGLAAGAGLGWRYGGAGPLSDWGVPVWVVALLGALVLAILAAVVYRAVLTATVAGLLGVLTPLLVWSATEIGDVRFPTAGPMVQTPLYTPTPQWLDGWLNERPTLAADAEPAAAEPEPDATASAAPGWRDRLRQVGDATLRAVRSVWTASPQPLRWILIASAAVGVFLGLVLGAAAPAVSAAIVTAVGGSALVLGTVWGFGVRFGIAGSWLPETASGWLIWWMVAAVIGLVLQWTFRPRSADKPAS